jgi:hypothetical protein
MDEFLALGHGRAQVREDRLLGEELVQGLHIALWGGTLASMSRRIVPRGIRLSPNLMGVPYTAKSQVQ